VKNTIQNVWRVRVGLSSEYADRGCRQLMIWPGGEPCDGTKQRADERFTRKETAGRPAVAEHDSICLAASPERIEPPGNGHGRSFVRFVLRSDGVGLVGGGPCAAYGCLHYLPTASLHARAEPAAPRQKFSFPSCATKGLFGVPHQTVQASPRTGIGSLVACTHLRARLSACKSLPAARLPSYAQIDLLCRAWLAGCSCFSPNDIISV
jgi:hypothetical protein